MLLKAGQQQTIARSGSLIGKGIHSGEQCELTVKPGEIDTGIVFQRKDIPGKPGVKAHPDNLHSASRATSLTVPAPDQSEKQGSNGELQVKTIEHLLASLAARGIDNLIVELNSSELPSQDGSAQIFAELLKDCGSRSQESPRLFYVPQRPLAVSQGSSYLLVLPPESFPAEEPWTADRPEAEMTKFLLQLEYQLDYGDSPPGYQQYSFTIDQLASPEERSCSFSRDLAAARTFALKREFTALRERGLARGGTAREALLFDADGPNQSLRYANEPARHKLLDLLGDLYLAGPLLARVLAVRTGHRHNHQMAGMLSNLREKEQGKN